MKTTLGWIAAALLAAAGNAWAGPSADLSFTGEVQPAACQLVAGTRTTVDYGTIPRATLSATDMTQLPNRPLAALTIYCDSQTSIGLRAVDNRSGVLGYGTLALAGGASAGPAQADRRFSLGQTAAGNPIGVWSVALFGAMVDGATAEIGIVAGGVLQSGDRDRVLRNDGKAVTWVSDGQLARGRTFTVGGEVSAGLARLGELPGASAIQLDGMATIEVIYL